MPFSNRSVCTASERADDHRVEHDDVGLNGEARWR